MTVILNGPRYLPEDGPIKKAVVFLHGYGSDGDDLIELAPMLARGLPHTVFYAPHAPMPTSFGFGYQWFSDAGGTFIDRPGVDAATLLLEDYIRRTVCEPHKLTFADVALVGFSMGTMTALHAAPRFKEQVAAVVGFAGMLKFPEALPAEIKQKPAVLLAHGTEDERIPAHKTAEAAQQLRDVGIEVESHFVDGLGHSIDGDMVRYATAFLQRHLAL